MIEDTQNIIDLKGVLETTKKMLAEGTRRRGEIQVRLNVIGNTIRTSGRMPDARYAALCREQSALIAETKTVEESNRRLKEEVKKQNADLFVAENKAGKQHEESPHFKVLQDILLELRKVTSLLESARQGDGQ